VEALKKRQRNIFAVANAISFSLSPILMSYLFIRYLDSNAIHEAIFILTLINTIGLTLFLTVDLLVPRYLLDDDYSRTSIFLFSLRTNLIFATITFLVTSISLLLEKSTIINFCATFLYIYSMALFYTCRSVLGGSNQFSRAFYLTSFDFLASVGIVGGIIAIGEIYFWSIFGGFALARIVVSGLWCGWIYRKDQVTKRRDFTENLVCSKKLVKIIINLAIVSAGSLTLNNLPILLISKSSISDTYLIQIVVLIQIIRGLIQLLSGVSNRSMNVLNEIHLKISNLTVKRVLAINTKIIVITFCALLSIFSWKGNDIIGIYTSQNVTFNIVVFTLVLINESLLYIFGILRLILISIGRVSILSAVIGATVLSLMVSWIFLNESNMGILYSVTISTLLGLAGLYFFSFLSKNPSKN
jgi:hypothetical protein